MSVGGGLSSHDEMKTGGSIDLNYQAHVGVHHGGGCTGRLRGTRDSEAHTEHHG